MCAEIRRTKQIVPHPFHALGPENLKDGCCPRSVFAPLVSCSGANGSATAPFYVPTTTGPWHLNPAETRATLERLAEADGQENILVCAAHDATLLMEFFPKGKLNDFCEKGWGRDAKWRFLKDFATAVGGKIEGVKGTEGWKD